MTILSIDIFIQTLIQINFNLLTWKKNTYKHFIQVIKVYENYGHIILLWLILMFQSPSQKQ